MTDRRPPAPLVRVFALAVLFPTLATVLPLAARAALPDEIQVYDDSINAPGARSLELHVNTTPRGNRTPSFPGERLAHHRTRITPEFALGIAPGFEAGLYLPMVLDATLRGDVAGIKPRIKWLPLRPADGESGAFAGVNVELSRIARRYDDAHAGLEMRAMLGWRGSAWTVAVNPVLGWGITAGHRGAPELKLAASVTRDLGHGLSVGLEHYGDYGPANRFAPPAERGRQVYAVTDAELPGGWSLHFGVGRGHGPADPWTVKAILSVGL